jgi:hypothetical protein
MVFVIAVLVKLSSRLIIVGENYMKGEGGQFWIPFLMLGIVISFSFGFMIISNWYVRVRTVKQTAGDIYETLKKTSESVSLRVSRLGLEAFIIELIAGVTLLSTPAGAKWYLFWKISGACFLVMAGSTIVSVWIGRQKKGGVR